MNIVIKTGSQASIIVQAHQVTDILRIRRNNEQIIFQVFSSNFVSNSLQSSLQVGISSDGQSVLDGGAQLVVHGSGQGIVNRDNDASLWCIKDRDPKQAERKVLFLSKAL